MEVARLLYNLGWSIELNELWGSSPKYFVPAIIFITYLYLDGTISNRKPLGLR